MALRAFAEAAAILDRDDYRQIALRNAKFVASTLLRHEGDSARLFRTYKDGNAHIEAFAEDYASLAGGLVTLYEATFETRWLTIARSLVQTLLEHFRDPSGGFYSTSDFHESLIARPKELYDNAVPSGNSEAAEVLLRLYLLTVDDTYESNALAAIQPLLAALGSAPTAFGRMLSALDFYLSSPAEVALIGDLESPDMAAMLRAVWKHYVPNKVIAASEPNDAEAARAIPLLEERRRLGTRATAYVCRNYVCKSPTTDPEVVSRLLSGGTFDVAT